MSRKYDIIVWGATGFTGQLVVEYLTLNAPSDLKWALGGRDKQKLEKVKNAVFELTKVEKVKSLDIVVADSSDQQSLDALTAQTRVIISTVGPFAKYGTPLVDACVRQQTDYVDITGETPWVRGLIDTYHETAVEKGVLIVNCCGFDSIPSDLGAYMVAKYIRKELNQDTKKIEYILTDSVGGASGGTIASMLNAFEGPSHIRKQTFEPYLLNPGPPGNRTGTGIAPRDQMFVGYNNDLKRWTSPFVMGPVNTRVVRRSNALQPYGPKLEYSECMSVGGFLSNLIVSICLIFGFILLAIPFTRNQLKKILPKPGEGPSRKQIENGRFEATIIGEAANGKKVIGTVKGIRDPGYGETAKMLSEAALALVLQRKELPSQGGVITPAVAFGDVLIQRLKNAKMTFEVKPL